MGLINTAARIFRRYVTDGVPASGLHQVNKDEIRAWGTFLESTLGQAGLGFAALALLNADLAHGAGALAVVYGDIAANNGLYRKSGASGSGSWTRVGDLPQSIVTLTVTGGTGNAIQASAIETPLMPGAKLYLLTPATNNTGATTILVNGGTAVPIKNAFNSTLASGALIAGSQVLMAWQTDHYQLLVGAAVDGNAILADAVAARDAASGFAAAAEASATAAAAGVKLDLDRIYQSKMYGLSGTGGYRRFINAFADGFCNTDGVNAGSSSNYQFDNIVGVIAPTFGTNVSTSAGAIASSTAAPGSLTQSADGVTSGLNGWLSGEASGGVNGVSYVGQNFGAGNTKHIRQFTIWQGWNGDTTYAISSVKVQYSDNGTAWTDLTTVSLTATVGAQTYNLPASAAHQYWRLLANAAPGAANRWGIAELQMSESQGVANMTVVTTAQTTDSSVSNARVLLEFDNTAAPTLNTDLTVEVTCNGGTNWTTATLTTVSSNSQGGRKVVETADTACTAGTSFAARIKTLNSKNIPVYGVSVTVH